MSGRPSSDVVADVARLLAMYDSQEIQDAIDILANPVRVKQLASLFALASQVKPSKRGRNRSPPPLGKRPTFDEQVAAVKSQRPEDAALIDEVLSAASNAWTQKRTAQIREILSQAGLPLFSKEGGSQRRIQLVSLVQNAPRQVLIDFVSVFEETHSTGGTLQQWSDIILKPK